MAKNVGAATALLLLIVALLSAHADAAGDRKLLNNPPPQTCSQAADQSNEQNGLININLLQGNTALFYKCCPGGKCCANSNGDAENACKAFGGIPLQFLGVLPVNVQCVLSGIGGIPITAQCVVSG